MQDNNAEVIPVPAVAAVIIEEGRILLVKRKYEPSRGKWSVPGGRVKPGETLSQTLRREVLEETGFLVEEGEVTGVYDVIDRSGERLLSHYVVIDYFARVTGGTLKAGGDALDVRWIPLRGLRRYRLAPRLAERLYQMTGI